MGKDALDKWCTENIDTADIIVGQGGEVVMLNMAWQCNQAVASRLVNAVRANGPVYAGLSASTMVAAKSMISKKNKDQDRPVFVPIRNGKVIEVNIHVQQ